jgi:hypothetical protein
MKMNSKISKEKKKDMGIRIPKTWSLVVFLSLGALLLAFSSPASGKYWKKCGDQPGLGAGWYNVRAHNMHCGKARKVAQAYTYGGEPYPLWFGCQRRRIGYELSVVSCRRDTKHRVQKVKFEVGA